MTTNWYQINAVKTLNNFGSSYLLKFNAYTGIIGEYGEFFDYMKKLYTHNLKEEKKKEILYLAPKELGDVCWYLSTSLAMYYEYTLDDIYYCIISKQYSLPIKKDKDYPIDCINDYIETETKDAFQMLMDFKKKLNRIDDIQNKDDAISTVAEVLLKIATIAKVFFNKDLSEILKDNIDKLKKRYPEGFDIEFANSRIDSQKKYKEEENMKVLNLSTNKQN